MTVFTRLLSDRRRGALWWGVGMVAGVGSVVGLWPTVRGSAEIERLVEELPAGVRALMGSQEAIPLSSAPGYLQGRLFSTVLPILLLIYAIGLGARAIGGAEEDGTLQLVVTAPVTRRAVAGQRLAASILLVVALAAVGLLTAVVLGAAVGLLGDVEAGRMLLATLAVAELGLLHLALAFAVGAATGRRGPAVSVASAVAVGSYVLQGLAAAAESIRPVRAISPWWWMLDRNLLVQDATFLSLGLPVVLSAALVVAGVARFDRRDLLFP